MLSLREVKAVLAANSLRPLKRLGQNFLIDANIKEIIIEAAAPAADDLILEIGPGLGALTFDLAARAGSVVAVEADRALAAVLRKPGTALPANVRLITADILTTDLAAIAGARRIKVVGNLPYRITTPVLEYLIANRRRIVSALVTIQKEVAGRIMSGPGTKEFGAMSCFVQYYTKPHYLRTIPPGAFYPVPEVASSLIRLDMRDRPAVDVSDEEAFFTVTRKAFNQRRKSLLNALSSKGLGPAYPKEAVRAALAKARVDPGRRAETLTLKEFALIADALA